MAESGPAMTKRGDFFLSLPLCLGADLFELLRLQHGERRARAAFFGVAEGAAVAFDAGLDRAQELALPGGEPHLLVLARAARALERLERRALGAGAFGV